MLRAAWFAQELLTTFQDDLGEVALIPSSGGAFFVYIDYDGEETLIWDRKAKGGFPGKFSPFTSLFADRIVEAKELKQLVRDIIKPEKDLGHSDHKMSRAKNVVDASEKVDGPVNTFDDKVRSLCDIAQFSLLITQRQSTRNSKRQNDYRTALSRRSERRSTQMECKIASTKRNRFVRTASELQSNCRMKR